MTIDALEGLKQADARSGLEQRACESRLATQERLEKRECKSGREKRTPEREPRIREAVLTDPLARIVDSGLLEQPGQSGREQRNRRADFEAVLTDPLQGYEKRTRRADVARTRKINIRSDVYRSPARI